MRPQVKASDSGILRETRDVEGALTVEACAMYTQVLGALRTADALLVKAMRAEHSHMRRDLTESLEVARGRVGVAAEKVYRVACESPDSHFAPVRDAQAALVAEAVMFLWPK